MAPMPQDVHPRAVHVQTWTYSGGRFVGSIRNKQATAPNMSIEMFSLREQVEIVHAVFKPEFLRKHLENKVKRLGPLFAQI